MKRWLGGFIYGLVLAATLAIAADVKWSAFPNYSPSGGATTAVGLQGGANVRFPVNVSVYGSVVISSSLVTTIDLSGAVNMTSLSVSGSTSLTTLSVNGSSILTSINFGSAHGLISLDVGNTRVTSLDLTTNTSIASLNLAGATFLTSLDLSNNTALISLDLSTNTSFTTLTLADAVALVSLDASNTAVVNIDLNGNTSLTTVSFANTAFLTTLGSSGLVSLSSINIGTGTLLTSVELPGAALSTSQVNAILVTVDANGLMNGSINLMGGTNGAPSGAGATAATSLIGKGWTVMTN